MEVVVVENDFIIQLFLEKNLQKINGCSLVGVFTNAEDTINYFKLNGPPKIIFMDIGLEGSIDGIDLFIELKSIWDAQVIYLTGNSDRLTLGRAERTNPLRIFHKPIEDFYFINECQKIFQTIR